MGEKVLLLLINYTGNFFVNYNENAKNFYKNLKIHKNTSLGKQMQRWRFSIAN
jgi:hypothetical protein